ncbi:MAG: zinc dependent phospholipase C family protein [Spirochaetales bacterium]|nr:zinc dependent phospholipase C family protein [Spirochaetales bacterium]
MPKEITHWWLAGEVLANLRTPVLAGLLKRNRNIFLLGSVGPDFLFYYAHGPEQKSFREAAMVLHGSEGGDTLAILAETADVYAAVLQHGVWPDESGNNLAEALWAFLFGYACHVAADSVFHPLVLYCAGKGTQQALYNHYLFETVLDLYVCDVLAPRDLPLRLRRLTAGMEMDRGAFLKLLGFMSFGGADYNREALKICLKRYESTQAFFWTFRGRTAARLAGALVPRLRHFIPSFYQKSYYRLTSVFNQTFKYRNPVSGVYYEHSVESLRGEVVRQAGAAAEVFEKILTAASCDPVGCLEKIHGPNLESGLFGDNAKKIMYTIPGGMKGVFNL